MGISLEEIENQLILEIASILSRDKSTLAVDAPLRELGIDSLEFVEILVFIENTFKLQLIESNLTKKDFETIHSLACLIHRTY